nr:hypothetical protein 13E11.50 [imported] - Neurospora crassa [Neurospora crassa]
MQSTWVNFEPQSTTSERKGGRCGEGRSSQRSWCSGSFVDGVVVVQWNRGAAIPLFPHYPSITTTPSPSLGTLDDPAPFLETPSTDATSRRLRPRDRKVSCSRLRIANTYLYPWDSTGRLNTKPQQATTTHSRAPFFLLFFFFPSTERLQYLDDSPEVNSHHRQLLYGYHQQKSLNSPYVERGMSN